MAQRLILPGKRILQLKRGVLNTQLSYVGSLGVYVDTGLSVGITPISPASIIKVHGVMDGCYAIGAAVSIRYRLVRNSTNLKLFGYPAAYVEGGTGGEANAPFLTLDQPGVAGSLLTYKIQVCLGSTDPFAGVTVNVSDPSSGQMVSEIFAEEIL